MGMVKEFKEFALRGNVMDLAVGVIMGASFGKIVNSLVSDILTPPLGYILGGVNFTELDYKFPEKTIGDIVLKPATLSYGKFLQATFDFIIVAACVFAMVKVMNNLQRRMKEQKPATPAEPPADVKLLGEIRDLLKSRG